MKSRRSPARNWRCDFARVKNNGVIIWRADDAKGQATRNAGAMSASRP